MRVAGLLSHDFSLQNMLYTYGWNILIWNQLARPVWINTTKPTHHQFLPQMPSDAVGL